MRYVKLVRYALAIAACLPFITPQVGAIGVSPPPPVVMTDSPVMITGYSFQGPTLQYIQLFNSSNEVIDLVNWQLQFSVSGMASPVDLPLLQGLLKPGGYVLAAKEGSVSDADVSYSLVVPPGVNGVVSSIRLIPADFLPHSITVKVDATHSHWKRAISTATGNYLSTFTAFTPDSQYVLYGHGFYEYPESVSLQITEVLANPRACSPIETSGDCVDFVKLYNPTAQVISLSNFRLRVGYLGQISSASNTFALAGEVQPGGYEVIVKSADDKPVSLTNSGAFLWIEDLYGMKIYETTVLEYPDASSDAKKGQAWAYDNADGVWKWTTQPTPFNSPSVFPVIISKPKVQVTAGSVPCKEGQYRSEETNRCRALASDVAVLAPCDDDEERNPATNRCRKLATLANQQLAACKEGQERSAETNRCRNVALEGPPAAAFAVEAAGEAGKAFVGWWAAGGVGMLGLGYGAWEWRREALGLLQKIGTFFTSLK